MAESTFNLTNAIKLVNSSPNIDYYYGPYESLGAACLAVPRVIRKEGRTLAVFVEGKLVEYWWPSSNKLTDADLVVKASAEGLIMNGGYKVLNISDISELDTDLAEGIYLVTGAVLGQLIVIADADSTQYDLNDYDKTYYS